MMKGLGWRVDDNSDSVGGFDKMAMALLWPIYVMK